jgi:hypothetical protein
MISMGRPGSIYAFDKDATPLHWPAVKPPSGWKWCPGTKHKAAEAHFKPDDGARCLYCNSHDTPRND